LYIWWLSYCNLKFEIVPSSYANDHNRVIRVGVHGGKAWLACQFCFWKLVPFHFPVLSSEVYPHTFHFPVDFQYLPPLSSPLTKLIHTQPQICFQVPPKTLSHTLRSTRNAPLYSLWQTMWTKVLARFKINFTGQKYISLCTYFI
jgi:hypothetical protein